MIDFILYAIGLSAYLVVAAWTFGYACVKWSNASKESKCPNDISWYYDDPATWITSLFWPLYLIIVWIFVPISKMGEKRAIESAKNRKLRIELEKKIRVEQEKIEQEIEEEIRQSLIG